VVEREKEEKEKEDKPSIGLEGGSKRRRVVLIWGESGCSTPAGGTGGLGTDS